jgi:hypothetical protein
MQEEHSKNDVSTSQSAIALAGLKRLNDDVAEDDLRAGQSVWEDDGGAI